VSLTLSINGLSLIISKFNRPTLPRAIVEPINTLKYSIAGSSAIGGPSFLPKYVWSISAILLPNESSILEGIWWQSDNNRRSGTSPSILLYDTNQLFVEGTMTPSRAIVPNTAVESIDSGHIAYYAQFNCLFKQPPTFEELGQVNSVSFALQELDTVSAA